MKEIAIIAEYEEDGKKYPAARLVNWEEGFSFSAFDVAAFAISLFGSFEKAVPLELQEKFSADFTTLFNAMFKDRVDYSKTIKYEGR